MLDTLAGFDWDVHNIDHIARHHVTPQEVMEATTRRYVVIPAMPVKEEQRWKLFGTSAAGRYLVVVFTIRRNRMRTVTAYTMNEDDRRGYGPQIE